jgi:hypothetical protein
MKTLRIMLVLGLVGTAGPAAADVADDLREADRYYEEGEYKKAAAAYDGAIRRYPGQVEPEAYAKRATIFVIQKDLEAGLAFIRDKAKKQHPNAAEVLEQEAVILWGMGKKGDAIPLAEKAAATKPSAFAAQLLIGDYYSARDPQKTATAYEAYLQYRPSDQESKDVFPRIKLGYAYLAVATTAVTDGRIPDAKSGYESAKKQFDTLKKKHGKNSTAALNADIGLCAAYTGLGKHDQAITVCETIVRNPKQIDTRASAWFNLGKSYLAKKQSGRARTAATEYNKLRGNEARGYILMGDAYLQEKNYDLALQNYQTAEGKLKPDQSKLKVNLSIKMGKTYLNLPKPDIANAISKLEVGRDANADDPELAANLGQAYLLNKQDDKALTTADRLVKGKSFAKLKETQRVALLLVSGKALYNSKKYKESRERFQLAHETKSDVEVRKRLVQVIEIQAYAAFADKDYKRADDLLDQAAQVDASSPSLSLKRAVMAIDQGKCDVAQKHLDKLRSSKGDALLYERLMGRTFLCLDKPNKKKAAEHYAKADAEAKKVQANLIQAEIYTEWAPILMEGNGNLDDVVSKLTDAVQFSAQSQDIQKAAKRNLAIALFKRGWKLLKDGRSEAAVADFERAAREPALLKGNEPAAFEFSHALALLDKGDSAEAAKMFSSLAKKGGQNQYLKKPYDKVGGQFFAAYASYRGGTPEKRAQAAKEFEKLAGSASGAFAAKIKDLLASSYEYVAYDQWRNGRSTSKSLAAAAKYASGDLARRIKHNQAVDGMKASSLSTFDNMNGSPPEALVNLGILYDKAGKPKEAYEAWTKAQAKGVNAKDLKKWIDAKKRIYGFN